MPKQPKKMDVDAEPELSDYIDENFHVILYLPPMGISIYVKE